MPGAFLLARPYRAVGSSRADNGASSCVLFLFPHLRQIPEKGHRYLRLLLELRPVQVTAELYYTLSDLGGLLQRLHQCRPHKECTILFCPFLRSKSKEKCEGTSLWQTCWKLERTTTPCAATPRTSNKDDFLLLECFSCGVSQVLNLLHLSPESSWIWPCLY